MILLKLSEKPKRPSELKKEIEGISEKVLYERLNIMTKLGFIKKSSNNLYPLEVHYSLVRVGFVNDLVNYLSDLPLSVEEFVYIISRKWVFEILDNLRSESSPKEILSGIANLKEKVLYQRLRDLEKLGLIERIIYVYRKPVVVKYRLTPEGYSVLPVLKKAYQTILSS